MSAGFGAPLPHAGLAGGLIRFIVYFDDLTTPSKSRITKVAPCRHIIYHGLDSIIVEAIDETEAYTKAMKTLERTDD